ncbi:TetR/AcrR family transcriptional regulator C-terminal domain-containing protein [Kineosporia sp. J2-2]|uniref:TetR/AcrR family transcriptional regulator C-terminal domain-containing protein n=1 Tax=Kineosporia corallincola TaxID=2835133 RepID=A0ABS5TMA1_9ACTN|nr:TetR/AcrR family transcriptional regulator [Kineosporia corallincola]MBT0772233.1 TetR/AcrR family transcriptional regulator C-terminal domain-containing protein [Kineosporia corallincola]
MAKRAERKGDPVKLIGLLWRPTVSTGRSGLTPKLITDAAIRVADDEGLDAITLRRVAEELHVSAMTLYPYIAGRPELIELMLDAVTGEVYTGQDLPAGRSDWRDRVRHIVTANWQHHLRHPWTVDVRPGRPVPGPGASGKYETELRALDGIGLSDLEMEHTLTSLLATVSGLARETVELNRAREQSSQSDLQWWNEISPVLATAMAGLDHPTAERVSGTLGETTGLSADPEGALRHATEVLVAGLAALLEGR